MVVGLPLMASGRHDKDKNPVNGHTAGETAMVPWLSNRTSLARLCGLCIVLVAGPAIGREYFVDQKHPEASDGNPGTEARPFKTIQPAVKLVGPGETVFVKGGLYEEPALLEGYGRLRQPKTITAWKDDRVVIGSRLCELPPANQWRPVAGRKSWQVRLPANAPNDLIVILDGKPIVTQRKDGPPADDTLNWATYRRADRTLMVNTGDGNPAALHKVQRARNFEPFTIADAGFWAIKKLEFAWLNVGLALKGTDVLVEDCFFHDTYRPAIFLSGRLCTIRRCSFLRCGYGLMGCPAGPSHIVEDCLFVGCGQEWYEDINSRATGDTDGCGGPFLCKGDASSMIVRHNVIADNKFGGLWLDCRSTGVRIIGNAFWSNRGYGLYNEFAVNDTLVLGNYFYEQRAVSSCSTRMSVIDNFFDIGRKAQGGGIVWENRDPAILRYGHMVLRGNAFTGIHYGYICGSDHGTAVGMWPDGFARAMVDNNRVRVLRGDYLLSSHGCTFKTLAEIQNRFGWDLHGEVKVYDRQHNDLTPEAMGGSAVTCRVPWGPLSHLARPLLSDAKIDGRWPEAPEYTTAQMPAFFWRVASGDYQPDDEAAAQGGVWQPDCASGYALGQSHGATWYVGAEDKYPDPKFSIKEPESRSIQSSGNRWLVLKGVTPREMPPSGIGWWTPWLATAPGAKTTVSLRLYGKDLQPTAKGAPAIYVQFINATGQQRRRVFLLGRDEQGVMHRPELTAGSYPWTNVKQIVIAPETAVRMALFLGMQPSKGELGLDDINLKTADGPLPANQIEVTEALPPRIARERMREIGYLDLAKAADRALADEVAGDGRGGWTDQGAELDMRNLKTGDQCFGRVPFRISASPQAVIVLRGNGQAGADLPQEAVVPVGRKLEALYLLHAAAFMDKSKEHVFEVAVKYADGTTGTWQASPHLLADWLAPPVSEFPEAGCIQTTAALTVPVGKSARGTIYRTEWIFDRSKYQVPVESITFRGTQHGVGIILALTGVTQW
jgi:hypothetical protein